MARSKKKAVIKKTISKKKTTKGIKKRKPSWLSGSEKKKQEGFDNLMLKWDNFYRTPLSYIDEADLQRLLDEEIADKHPRWNFVKRLHSAKVKKQSQRERAVLKSLCDEKKNKLKLARES